MSYDSGEDKLLTLIQGLSNFDATNSVQGNYLILNSGSKPWRLILFPGGSPHRERFSGGGTGTQTIEAIWNTIAELWVIIGPQGYGTATNNLKARAQEITDLFDQYPFAGDTTRNISRVIVRSQARPIEMSGKGKPTWLMQELMIEWKEQSSVTLQE